MSPEPVTDNTPSEGFVVQLSESQYAVLFYCLDILLDSQDVMLSPEMAADVREIRHRLSINLLTKTSTSSNGPSGSPPIISGCGICAIR